MVTLTGTVRRSLICTWLCTCPWPHLVNLGVDDVELLHAEHARHGPGLDGAQVGVVDGELPAVTINTQLLYL